MSEVLNQCPFQASSAQVRPRPSMARKRPAAAALRPLTVLGNLPSETPRVPSAPSSELSSASSDFYDFEAQTDLLKRSRHDSGISTFSDESDSQSSISTYSPDYSLGSAESQASSSSNKNGFNLLVHNSKIGHFRVVGAGRECKAFDEHTGLIFDARVLTEAEYQVVVRVLSRLDEAEKYYNRSDIEELRNAVLPAKVEVIEEVGGRAVMFTPIFRRSLHSFAQERGVHITEAELQPMFEQIIKILAFCHSIGIIIRDLKPRKLVFDEFNRIRLHHVRDCVVLDDPSNDTVYEKFGSPAYVQPEVLSAGGAGYSGKAADMWSFGVLIFLLLLGRYPFFDKTPIGVLQRIMQARVYLPTTCQISRHARVLLYSLLRKCPEKRPTAEQLVYIPWGQAKNLPSRGSNERVVSRRIIDELIQSTYSSAVNEQRPAVPLDGDRTNVSSPASGETSPEFLRQIAETAQRMWDIRRSMQMTGLRSALQDVFSQ